VGGALLQKQLHTYPKKNFNNNTPTHPLLKLPSKKFKKNPAQSKHDYRINTEKETAR